MSAAVQCDKCKRYGVCDEDGWISVTLRKTSDGKPSNEDAFLDLCRGCAASVHELTECGAIKWRKSEW